MTPPDSTSLSSRAFRSDWTRWCSSWIATAFLGDSARTSRFRSWPQVAWEPSIWHGKETTNREELLALKVLGKDLHEPDFVRRFEAEIDVLTRLVHANIAQYMDRGVSSDGRPYYVMEYVLGQPIDAGCDALHLSIEDRIRAFLEVCAAVQYAHQRLVVHPRPQT